MKHTLSLVSVASSLFILSIRFVSAAPVADPGPSQNETSIARRGGVTEGIIGFIAPYLQEAMFGKTIQCCEYFPDGSCWAAEGMDPDNQIGWDVCFTPGTQLFSQADADVAKCLTNLHYVQADACISVAGSSCDNGYIASGGRIQNAQLSWIGGGYALNSEQSWAIQDGIQALVGSSIRSDVDDVNAYMPVFSALSATNGVDEVDMFLRYIGEDVC